MNWFAGRSQGGATQSQLRTKELGRTTELLVLVEAATQFVRDMDSAGEVGGVHLPRAMGFVLRRRDAEGP